MQVHRYRSRGTSGTVHRVLRRSRQFFRATFARVRPEEIAALQAILTPAQMALFQGLDRSDQRHSLDVLYTLREADHHDPDLQQAALLHDASKAASRLTVWHRTAVVLLHWLAPNWLDRLAADGRDWKQPFTTHVQHAQASAALAAQAGCTPEAVDLIRRHHEPEPDDRRLALLQWADEQN